jgi:hypothetical protein
MGHLLPTAAGRRPDRADDTDTVFFCEPVDKDVRTHDGSLHGSNGSPRGLGC